MLSWSMGIQFSYALCGLNMGNVLFAFRGECRLSSQRESVLICSLHYHSETSPKMLPTGCMSILSKSTTSGKSVVTIDNAHTKVVHVLFLFLLLAMRARQDAFS